MQNLHSRTQLPFELNIDLTGPVRRKLLSPIKGALERVLLLRKLNETYSEASLAGNPARFIESTLASLKIDYDIPASELARIPTMGPLVVVANHPFGIAEGLVLASILQSVRPDVRILANPILNGIPELRDVLVPIDPWGTTDSTRANVKPMREAIQWVKDGGVIAIFPAGEVAHIDLLKWTISDPEWKTSLGRIIQKTEAPAMPVFFNGMNGPLFHLIGLLNSRLRTAMLPRELYNKEDHSLDVRIGTVIPFERLNDFGAPERITLYLRERTYLLACRRPEKTVQAVAPSSRRFCNLKEVIPPREAAALCNEIAGLPSEQTLLKKDEFTVAYACSEQIPILLEEIGRLREITFRHAGEGTGKATDLDQFDAHYVHLFLWNNVKNEVVGAYRLGKTDHISKSLGKEGLYTHSLFEYDADFLDQIGPALELGRSFVRPEYQKAFHPLFLLWKGIARYVARHPRYKILFGPVSIDNDYHKLSHQLVVEFLTSHHFDQLANLVRARTPFRRRVVDGLDARALQWMARDIEDVSELIADVENNRRGIPILLKQYLKLGGRILGFNVDPSFSNVVDALILVDLTLTDQKVLARYMGDEDASSFLHHHGGEALRSAARAG